MKKPQSNHMSFEETIAYLKENEHVADIALGFVKKSGKWFACPEHVHLVLGLTEDENVGVECPLWAFKEHTEKGEVEDVIRIMMTRAVADIVEYTLAKPELATKLTLAKIMQEVMEDAIGGETVEIPSNETVH